MSNITNNRINVTILPAVQNSAIQHIRDAADLLPFLVGLVADEKKSMQGINLSNKQFVEDCLNEMDLEPGILPTFIDPNSVRNDYQLWLQLDQIKLATHDLLDKLSDTQYLAGAEAYKVCLIYYRLVEAAAKAGLPGADERYNRLKERFKDQGPQSAPAGPSGQAPTFPQS
jgi:hypothetical protein